MTTEELARRIEQTPIGPFAILLGMSDEMHFNEVFAARAAIVSALRNAPAVVSPAEGK